VQRCPGCLPERHGQGGGGAPGEGARHVDAGGAGGGGAPVVGVESLLVRARVPGGFPTRQVQLQP
jgi:hypothetical protein